MKKMTPEAKRTLGKKLLIVGAVCVTLALALFIYNRVMDGRAAAFSGSILEEMKQDIEELGDTQSAGIGRDPYTLPQREGKTASAMYQGYSFMGYLTIDSLSLELPVMTEWDYDRLNVSACRYSGSFAAHNLVIAAHNYSNLFGSISKLTEGDSVVFTDINGAQYRFTVRLVETLEPTAIEEMTAGDYDLSLFTCNLTGAVRVTVRCERTKE